MSCCSGSWRCLGCRGDDRGPRCRGVAGPRDPVASRGHPCGPRAGGGVGPPLPVLADALRDGAANLAQAQVIVRALDGLPREVPAEVVGLAEERLVGYAAQFGPRQLARLGRRILDVVAPEIADAAEARRLAALEEAAHRKTRLSLRRVGDGTTRLTGLLPDAAAYPVGDLPGGVHQPPQGPRRPRPGPHPGRGPVGPAALPPPPRRSLPPPPRGHRPEAAPGPRRGRDHPVRHDHPGPAPHRARRRARSSPPTSPATTTAATSPPPKPAGWPATRPSSPPSWAGSRRSWTRAAPSGCSPRPSARP